MKNLFKLITHNLSLITVLFTINSSLLIINCLKAQSPLWKYYYSIEYVSSMAEDSNSMWITTGNGLFQIDKTTGNVLNDYHTWNSEIPSNWNNVVFVDSKGNKWIGSYGLTKFDGTNWTWYNQSNSGLPEDGVDAITEDSSGSIWVGTVNGWVAKLNNGNWTIYGSHNSNQLEGTINSIAVDKKDNIWIAGDQGTEKFDGSNWIIYSDYNSGLPSSLVNSVTIDKYNKKWFSTYNGIAVYNDSTWTYYNAYSNCGLTDNFVGDILIDKNNNKWVYTNKGEAKLDEKTQQWNVVYDTTKGVIIHIDNEYNQWFLSGDYLYYDLGGYSKVVNGVIKFDGTNWRTTKLSNSGLEENTIKALTIDKMGNIWIGTAYSGITKFDGLNWNSFHTLNSGLSENEITGLGSDDLNNIWISTTDGGIVKYDEKNWTNYNILNSKLAENVIHDIKVDKLGNIWIGTEDSGAVKYDGKNWTTYHVDYFGLRYNSVNNIYINKNNDKYFATSDGIVKYNDTIWKAFTNDTLGFHGTLAVLNDNKNNIWESTGYGLVKFDGINYTIYNTGNSNLPNNNVESMMQEKNENLWFGTWANGMVKFDGNNWYPYNFTINKSQISSTVWDMVTDSLGNKWFATEIGLVEYNENGIKFSIPENKNSLPLSNIKIYPNPANQQTVISYQLPANYKVLIEIMDMFGNKIYFEKNSNNKSVIDVSKIPDGIYFVRVSSSIFIKSGKLIISH